MKKINLKKIKGENINIPERIKDFNFVLIGSDGKQPIEKGWQKKIHKIDDIKLQEHISKGKNYGVQGNNSQVVINGETYFLLIIDFDKKDFQDKVINHFPETFTTTSGSPKNCFHIWLASDNNKSFKIKDEKLDTLADVLGESKQIIAPNSKHSFGSIYSIVKDIPIAFMAYAEIEAILKPHNRTPKKIEKPQKQYVPKGMGNDITEKILSPLSMQDVLKEVGIDTSKNPTNCFGHSSAGGKCLGWNNETAHCFHCDKSWNKYSLIRDAKNLTDKETFEWFAEKVGMINELEQSRKEFKEKNKKIPEIKEAIDNYYDKSDLSEQIWNIQPFFYDNSKIWWLWDKEKFFWKITDDKEILCIVKENSNANTINAKEKCEIIESMEQFGRRKIPKQIKSTWIQFKNRIVDIKTGEEFEASPKWFVTNPIPWELHKEKFVNTPIMDRIFTEWVGEDHIKTLYEIIAYCILSDYPIHRLFCLIGEGMNGKTCFLRLLIKFIGENNITSTELDTLLSSRFEVTRLHKKLICIMGETNFSEMSKTSIIKKLTGQDLIGFEYKNKNPFTDKNYAKIIIATNNLPTTTDKTIGFYRRWLIIDFPNKFSEKKDILEDIPDEEYEILAIKCMGILKDLLENKEFNKEGTIEERAKKYEDKSDPLEKFFKEFVDEDFNGFIWKFEFEKRLNEWCKENRFRQLSEIVIGRKMTEKRIEQEQRMSDWLIEGQKKLLRAWIGIKWKEASIK